MRGNKAFRETQLRVGAEALRKANQIMQRSAVASAYYKAILDAAAASQSREEFFKRCKPT